MNFKIFGIEGAPVLMMIPGLGVSYEIFLPLIDMLKEHFHIVAAEVDGFTLGVHTSFTSIDDQAGNVWSCYHWTGLWRWVFHSHYFDVLLDECRKIYPFGGIQAVLDGYKSVYTNKLLSLPKSDISFWYGSKEAFVAVPQVKHLKSLCPEVKVELFDKMNHGQLLVDHPDQVARRIMATGVMDSDQISTSR